MKTIQNTLIHSAAFLRRKKKFGCDFIENFGANFISAVSSPFKASRTVSRGFFGDILFIILELFFAADSCILVMIH